MESSNAPNYREWSYCNILKLPTDEQAVWQKACETELSMLKECNVWEITNRPINRKIIKNHWVFVSRVLLLEWCRDNSIVWENPVRENTTHYTVEYTCKTVLVVSIGNRIPIAQEHEGMSV